MENIEDMRPIEELVEKLFVVVGMKNTDANVREYMQGIYEEKRMVTRKVDKILKGQIMLNTLNESELGVWCVYLYEFTKNESINPTKYYPDFKIETIKQYYDVDNKKTKTDKIVLQNVIKVKNQYLCPFISYEDIALFMGSGLIEYNIETQRDPNITKVKNVLLKQPNINWTSVKEISEIIDKNAFIANLLTFNVLRTSNFSQDSMKYNEKEKTLTIIGGMQVLDGFHRIIATLDSIDKAKENDVILDYGFMASIVNLSTRDAQSLISREDKRNPISQDYTRALEKNPYTIFIDALNETGETSTNEMYGRITNSLDEIGLEKYVTTNILQDALKLTELELDRPRRNDKYLEHLIYVLNTIIGDYLEKYNYDLKKVRKMTILFEPNSFIGYVAVAKELLDKVDKKELLDDMLKNGTLDLNRDKEIWNDMEMFKRTPKSYKKIYNYFKEIVELNDAEKGGEE